MKNLNLKNYLALATVAILAGTIGWGASAFSLTRKSEAMAPPVEVAPITNQLAPAAPLPEQVTPTQVIVIPQPVATQRVSAQRRPRLITRSQQEQTAAQNDSAPEVETTQPAEPASRTMPVRNRNRDDEPKSGMSNTLKSVIAIGGGAATGAAVGGLAGGKKGAAIGALAGGGGGAIYSIIRKKQGKEVW